jgi:competence protein ComEA
VPPPTVVGGWVPAVGAPGPSGEDEPGGADPGEGGGVAPPARRVPLAAAAAALALAVAVALVVWLRSAGAGQLVEVPARPPGAVVASPSPAVPSFSGPPSLSSPGPTGGATAGGGLVVVDVEGRVRRPGLVRLPAGSRVADAVRSAGGAAPGAVLARLNLARVLADGEQLLVPGPGDPEPSGPAGPVPGGAPAGAPGTPVDLNTATQEGLDALPGVGPVLAGRILAWRTQHGRFSTVDELGEVPGIGPKALERLRPLVRV